jgi:hypothetical protein
MESPDGGLRTRLRDLSRRGRFSRIPKRFGDVGFARFFAGSVVDDLRGIALGDAPESGNIEDVPVLGDPGSRRETGGRFSVRLRPHLLRQRDRL